MRGNQRGGLEGTGAASPCQMLCTAKIGPGKDQLRASSPSQAVPGQTKSGQLTLGLPRALTLSSVPRTSVSRLIMGPGARDWAPTDPW